MKLTCHPYRYQTEPIRTLCHWKHIDLQETEDKSKFPTVPSLQVSDKSIIGFWEIIDELLRPTEESKQDNSFELYKKARTASNDIVKRLQAIEESMIVLSGLEEVKKSETVQKQLREVLTELAETHKNSKFFYSAEATPVDLYLYNFYRTIDSIHSELLPPAAVKYIERVEAQKFMRSYLSKEANYRRDYSPAIPSFTNRFLGIFEDKVTQLADFAMMQGILYKTKIKTADSGDVLVPTHTPLSLYPKRILKEDYQLLTRVQDRWNIMLNEMARDFDWYKDKLKQIIEADEFVRRTFEIKKKCAEYPKCQDKQVCIFRNDYMYDSETNRWLQVEYNCVAISFGPIGDRVHNFHKKLCGGYLDEKIPDLPNNENLMAEALYEAYKLYGNPKAKVLVIVKDTETNVFDQRYMELRLFERGIESVRMTFKQIYEGHRFDKDTGKLYVNGDEIGLVYYRTGYTIEDYECEEDWKIREIIELSQAIKCPSVDFILINFKIFQLYFAASDEELKRFVKDQKEFEEIKSTFAEFHYIETPEDKKKVIELVKQSPGDFVLKPQLEGGGHNFYGDNIIPQLEKLSESEIKGYFLMGRINSNPSIGYFIKNSKLLVTPAISEIGIFGYVLSDKDKVIKSATGGCLLRTKSAASDEGGVAAGYGVVDSVYIQ
eukprot:CAMPEP_0176408024 /NCGR_PEP_ID=MMETSP0127-20121128/1722_1 /TAXON_ID=938130 /ORGANISM="Platyophrya macrostoma, Strain WH" /LENGTH=660 /DNA_ID=CAMNT_0017787265 /DNA_START=21 /DNA_END=2003 /DNA_ORIENTATION=-